MKFWLLFFTFFLGSGNHSTAHGGEAIEGMVFFPPGEFMMGSDNVTGKDDEHPKRPVYLDGFYLDQYEVSGKDFEIYLEKYSNEHPTITGWYGRKVKPDMADSPVFGLTWERCQNYCLRNGKRLPTEAEWERAASGLEERLYPWGNEEPSPEHANFGKCCFIMRGSILSPVDGYEAGKTPEGVYNLAGNIAEWVYDWYDRNYYKDSPYKNPRGPESGEFHVIRGGAWNSLPVYLRNASRYGYDDAKDYYGIGCRCALSGTTKVNNE
ncbi:MAG: formylglycine-generating enzyme family protein [Candidatus Nitrohelix vancouverensis]|uniref:Formylglycine-generating enzyme family protein n=1 Tax=Candidatus Nitrohelix vancouverensis TaxID=2705534 RepID=A0A7T0C3G6_9BACT|nr:MAG: formylglycine-generating enzyme family protein [Candidatus Nitrohelix vancouverensis]